MSTYDLGDVVTLAATVRDADGDLVDAGSIVCTLTLPDGTTATPTVTRASLGTYSATYTPAAAGRFLVRWVTTGAGAAAFVDDFVVSPAAGVLLTRSDLEDYLHRTIAERDVASANAACAFADAVVFDTLGFDPVAGDYDLAAYEITLIRGIAVRIAAQWFTNPEDRASYNGPEGLSYSASPQMLSRIMSEADRRTLLGVQNRYAPGFA